MSKNAEALRRLVDEMKIGHEKALSLWNRGQVDPLTLGQWNAYTAQPNTPSWIPCPDSVVLHMEAVLRDWRRQQIEGERNHKI